MQVQLTLVKTALKLCSSRVGAALRVSFRAEGAQQAALPLAENKRSYTRFLLILFLLRVFPSPMVLAGGWGNLYGILMFNFYKKGG